MHDCKGLHIKLFGIYTNNLLKSGSKDYIRKFIIVDSKKSTISIGNYEYLID